MRKYNDIQFVNNVKQPMFGSYISSKIMFESVYEDNVILPKKEGIDSELIDVAVNCLTKYMLTHIQKSAFRVPLLGARIYGHKKSQSKEIYQQVLNSLTLINGLNKQSIYVAINLAQFDAYFSKAPIFAPKIKKIDVPESAYDAVFKLVTRNLQFFEEHGPVGKISFDFIDAKADVIANASLDIVTRDSLWNLSTSKSLPNEQDRLLIAIHYIMFMHSPDSQGREIKTIGIFNSRLNSSFTINVKDLPKQTLFKFEKFLGYKEFLFK